LFFFTFKDGWKLTPCSKIVLKLDKNHDGKEDKDLNKKESGINEIESFLEK
jgi:hypothetical protein